MSGEDLSEEVRKAAEKAVETTKQILVNSGKSAKNLIEHPLNEIQREYDAINNSPIGYRGLANRVRGLFK